MNTQTPEAQKVRVDPVVSGAHAEALAINRQLAKAHAGVTAQNVIDLNRFCDCAEDGEGYDVPMKRMCALKAAGLVEGGRGGWYTQTDEGLRLREAWHDVTANAQVKPWPGFMGHRLEQLVMPANFGD